MNKLDPKKADTTSFRLWIGGAAGEGIAAAGQIFIKSCARSGLQVYAYNSYESVIRGGHVLFRVEVGAQKPYLQPGSCDILIALNQETIDIEGPKAERGILFNSDRFKLDNAKLKAGAHALGFPCNQLTGKPLMQNTAALGAAAFLAGLDIDVLVKLLRETFGKKTTTVIEENMQAARAGHRYAENHFSDMPTRLAGDDRRRLVLSGNEAMAFGALAAGCKFFSAYPMTPASPIMHWLAPRAAEHGVVFKQTEDEIAAINMAIGASIAGARAMTATSGGGFALMTEALGLAGMIEAPLVVVEVQRAGPSTGLPTKSEQGDLFQVLGAGQGDYPKIVLAPTSVEDAFYIMGEAFNLAERFQMPVVVLSDLILGEHRETVEDFDTGIPIDRGVWAKIPANGKNGFKRYALTPSGVSPRAVPGQAGLVHVAATDEHDEKGCLISDVHPDPTMRALMMDKRMRKLEFAAKIMKPPTLEGPADAELTLVTWGSSCGAARHAMRRLNQDGQNRVNVLPLRCLHPFPDKQILSILKGARKVMALEANYTGQMCRLVRMETGFDIARRWLQYDGEPFDPDAVIHHVEEALND